MDIDLSFAEKTYTPKGAIDDKQSNKLPQLYFSSRAKNKRIRKLFNIANLIDKNYTLSVGWFDGDKYPTGEDVGVVAYKQEHGFETTLPNGKSVAVPPRPFVRPAMANNRNKWRKQALKEIKIALSENKNIKACFNNLGKTVRDDIQQEIMDVYEPPLSDYTIDQRMEKRGIKNFNRLGLGKMLELTKPLIDTGRMINSCKYSVKKG